MIPANQSVYNAGTLEFLERLDNDLFKLVFLDPPWDNRFTEHKDVSEYHSFISHLVQQAWRTVDALGSLYIHLPPVAEADIDFRLMINQCIGQPPSSVIVWKHMRQSNVSGTRQSHDEILRYNKSAESTYNMVALPKDLSRFSQSDDRGPYILMDVTAPVNRPNRRAEWQGSLPPKGRSWKYSAEQMDQFLRDGRIVKTNGRPRIKRYADEAAGRDIGTVWDDIPPVRIQTRTHMIADSKPQELCSRIIKQATNEGDWVLDPMSLSGQLLLEAEALGRKWCGCESAASVFKQLPELHAERAESLGCEVKYVQGDALNSTDIVWDEYIDIFLSVDELAGAKRKLATFTGFITVLKQELASESLPEDEIIEALHDSVPQIKWLLNADSCDACARRLKNELDGFDLLERDSQGFLITAYAALDMIPGDLDFSVISVSSWKTVENEIGTKLFKAFRNWVKQSPRFQSASFAEDNSKGGPRKQLIGFLLNDGKPFTLGSLEAVCGIYGKARPDGCGNSVSDALYAFINQTFTDPLRIVGDTGVLRSITPEVVNRYRNGAAHDNLYSKERATESLEYVMKLLPQLIKAFERR